MKKTIKNLIFISFIFATLFVGQSVSAYYSSFQGWNGQPDYSYQYPQQTQYYYYQPTPAQPQYKVDVSNTVPAPASTTIAPTKVITRTVYEYSPQPKVATTPVAPQAQNIVEPAKIEPTTTPSYLPAAAFLGFPWLSNNWCFWLFLISIILVIFLITRTYYVRKQSSHYFPADLKMATHTEDSKNIH